MSSFAPSEMFVPLPQHASSLQLPMGYQYDMGSQQAYQYQQQPSNHQLQMSSSYDLASHQAHLQEQASNHQLQMSYSYDMTGQQVHQQHPPNLQLPMAHPYEMASQHALPQEQQEGLSPSASCESPESSSIIGNRVFVGGLQIEVDEGIVKRIFEKKDPTYVIRDIKVLRELNGQSKGYGFVTYDNIEQAQEILKKEPGAYMFKGRAWNIAPAIRRYTPRASPLPQNVVYYHPYSPSLGPYSPAVPFSPMVQYHNGTSFFF